MTGEGQSAQFSSATGSSVGRLPPAGTHREAGAGSQALYGILPRKVPVGARRRLCRTHSIASRPIDPSLALGLSDAATSPRRTRQNTLDHGHLQAECLPLCGGHNRLQRAAISRFSAWRAGRLVTTKLHDRPSDLAGIIKQGLPDYSSGGRQAAAHLPDPSPPGRTAKSFDLGAARPPRQSLPYRE